MTNPVTQDTLHQQRAKWTNRGQQRPPFAQTPAPDQESVWDYPRPPVIEENYRPVKIYADEQLLAASQAGFRVLETAGAPTYYMPPEDIEQQSLVRVAGYSFCEWKGQADYWALAGDSAAKAAAWTYPEPFDAFLPIAGFFAFYPALLRCFLGDERVKAQPGGFYGGWVTDDVVGPFKGEAGTSDW